MRSFVVGLAVLGSLAACDSTTASNANPLVLAERQAQWNHRSFHSYSFDYVNAEPIGQANVHVIVTADAVTSVIDATTGLPPQLNLNVPTIDGIFDIARGVIDQKHSTVTLEFNSEFGYPSHVSAFDNNPGGGYNARVSNLQPILGQ